MASASTSPIPQQAIRRGLALIPEDRRAQGLVLDHSVRDNLLLPLLRKIERGSLIDDGQGQGRSPTP